MPYIEQTKQRLMLILFTLLVPLTFIGLLVAPLNGATVAKEIAPLLPVTSPPLNMPVEAAPIAAQEGQVPLVKAPPVKARRVVSTVTPTIDFSPRWVIYDGSVQDIAVADIDGNGQLDMAAAGLSVTLYYNSLGGGLPPIGDQILPVPDSMALAWGDVDNDADPDLAIATAGADYLYLNEGGTLASTPTWQSAIITETQDLVWGDVNGDGWLDLITGGEAGWHVYLNDQGSLPSTANYSDANGIEDIIDMDLGDWDNDGDLDLVVVFTANLPPVGAEYVFIYINEGGQLQTIYTDWNGSSTYFASAEWVDFNSDGLLDLSVAGATITDTYSILLHQNMGETFQLTWGGDQTGEALITTWGDADNDGDLDLFAGYANEGNNEATSNAFYLYNSGGTFTTIKPDNVVVPTQAAHWVDLDQDNDLDLLLLNDGNIQVYRNDHLPFTAASRTGAGRLDAAEAHFPAWGDIDNDGDLDLAAAQNVYLNDGGHLQTTPVWTTTDSAQFAWGDVNGDGYLDLAASHGGVYLNQGGSLSITPTWTTAAATSVAWGDVDGDEDLDLAMTQGGATRLYLNVNGILSLTWQATDPISPTRLAWGDVDQDGDLDLAVANNGPNQLYLNQKGALSRQAVWQSAGSFETVDLAWGDINGDGTLDLATANRSGSRIYFNMGNALETVASWGTAELYRARSMALGDVDGDGDIDMIIGHRRLALAEPILFYRNEGGALNMNGEILGQQATTGVALVDVNGDGSLDLTVLEEAEQSGHPVPFPSIYYNQLRPSPSPYGGQPMGVSIHSPNSASTNFYSVPTIQNDHIIPITYTLYAASNQLMQQVRGYYSLDGGGHWLPAVPTSTTAITALATTVLSSTILSHSWGITLTPAIDLRTSVAATEYAAKDRLLALPDLNTTTSTLSLAGLGNILDVDVWLNINHTYAADLDVSLTSPAGTVVSLFNDIGGDGDNFSNLILNQQITVSINSLPPGQSVYSGIYQPTGDLTNFDGESPNGNWQLTIIDDKAGDTGMLVSWGLLLRTEGGATHVFYWDTFRSGVFGQSDNVVFRLEAVPNGIGRHDRLSATQLPYIASQSLPFRLRGTQVKVTTTADVPLSGVVVYHLPKGQVEGARPLSDAGGRPYRTNHLGFLEGRGEIKPGDQLAALLPISHTRYYTLYYTSAPPLTDTLDMQKLTKPGIITLTAVPTNTLMVFNLDMSLEWDARNDGNFLADLEDALAQSSAVLYDVSNGQMALGDVNLYFNKEKWLTADIVMYAQTGIRPRATMGGVVSHLTDDIVSPTLTISNAYGPGQIRLGPNWDPFGTSLAELTQDWQRALAHELSHYLLYLPDNYMGIEDGRLIGVDCFGSFMTSTYDDAYSEFLTEADWDNECLRTVAAKTTGRTDWETIHQFYPFLTAPISPFNPGPAIQPLRLTRLITHQPATAAATYSPLFYDVRKASDNSLLPLRQAQGYLYQEGDDRLIPLGSTVGGGDRLKVRGGGPGDKVCVFGPIDDSGTSFAGCLDGLDNINRAIRVDEVTNWQPDIIVRSRVSETILQTRTSQTIDIIVTLVHSRNEDLQVQIFPAYGGLGEEAVSASWKVMTAVSPITHTATFTLNDPIFEYHVRVWLPGATPTHETISHVFLSPPWGPQTTCTGDSCGSDKRAWGANRRLLGAPAISGDGQVTIFNLEDVFAETGTVSLQALNAIPDLPTWVTQVGQGYRFRADEYFPRSLAFEYLLREVPPGYEDTLAIYYRANGSPLWQRLATSVDMDENQAVAIMPDDAVEGQGIYVLVATVEMTSLEAGWNLFTYPNRDVRLITETLASIAGEYQTVYDFTGDYIYDTTIPDTFAEFVNDLDVFENLGHYWIYVTKPVTIYVNVQNASNRAPNITLPPATFYG